MLVWARDEEFGGVGSRGEGGVDVEEREGHLVLLGSIKEGGDGNSGVEAKECVARAERIIERLIFG